MLNVRSFYPGAVMFSSQRTFRPKQVKVADQLLTFQSVDGGIYITQSPGANTLQLRPSGITRNNEPLTEEARKGLILTLYTLVENAKQKGANPFAFTNVNGKSYLAAYGTDQVTFQQTGTANTITIASDLIRFDKNRIAEEARKDLIEILRQLLEMQ